MKNKRMHSYLFLFLVAVLGLGCTSYESIKMEKNQEHGLTFLTTTAGLRYVMVGKKDPDRFTCTEPMPDASFGQESGFGDSLSAPYGKDSVSEGQETIEGGVGGRSTNLLITREIFFRYCEFMVNTNLTKEERVALFKKVLEIVQSINSKDLGTGTGPGREEMDKIKIIENLPNQDKNVQNPQGKIPQD